MCQTCPTCHQLLPPDCEAKLHLEHEGKCKEFVCNLPKGHEGKHKHTNLRLGEIIAKWEATCTCFDECDSYEEY